MSNYVYRFINPIDVLFARGNKSFGDPGSYGASLVPPWPSVVAGALRSRILVEDKTDLAAFAAGKLTHPILGTPEQPGVFRLRAFHLARRFADGRTELLAPPPADLVISEPAATGVKEKGEKTLVQMISPTPLSVNKSGWTSSYPLPLHPVLRQKLRTKPADRRWLTESGWKKYLDGKVDLIQDDLIDTKRLWDVDVRVGVGLEAATRAAAEGRLFTVEAVAFLKREHGVDYDVGFLVAVAGLPQDDSLRPGVLRLGGDGRAAALEAVPEYKLPEPDYERFAAERKCRLILATPGIFQKGWLPDGVKKEKEESGPVFHFELQGVRGKLVAACVPRAEVISGWNLAKGFPKEAQRAVPAGAVYWLDELEARPEDLKRLAESGLWAEPCPHPQRRAEGFNLVWVAAWAEGPKTKSL